MTSFDTLRQWEGEQSRAFEELSYQLLRDRVPAGTRAIRTGNPDGGVEWYAVEADGTEHGWQAKHVHEIGPLLTAMTESVKRVAKERPTLRTLTFVISWNLGSSRQVRQGRQLKSQRDKFNDKIAVWKKTIPGADKIAFELVQGSELLDELSKPEHVGRRWFWWGETVLGHAWLRDHFAVQAEVAGEKYRPDLQVDVPIQEDLLALGFDARVREHLRLLVHEVVAGIAESRRYPPAKPSHLYAAVAQAVDRLATVAAGFDLQAGDAVVTLERLETRLEDVQRAAEALIRQERSTADGEQQIQHGTDFRDLLKAVRELSSWLFSSPGRTLRRQAYFLSGVAGSGKTHLLLDAAGRALDQGRPAVFLAGAQLGRGELWASICDQLGLENLGADVLLKAMDTAGEAATRYGSRFLLIIDAVNETVPADFWYSRLAGLRAKVAQYPHVALVVSCRDTYRNIVADRAEQARFHQRTHPGFAGHEIEATLKYFAHFGLEAPKIPLLTPEFTLPLFLRMYCESVAYTGPATTYEGHQGRVTIFENYLEAKIGAVARRLTPDAVADSEREAARARIRAVLDTLVDEMALLGREGLTSSEADTVVQTALKDTVLPPTKILGLLQDEGVLNRERLHLGAGTFGDGFRITFQAFSDFLLLIRRLTTSPDPLNDTDLHQWLAQDASEGIVEAATIVFPEVYGAELPDVLGVDVPAASRGSNLQRRNRAERLIHNLTAMLPYRATTAVTERTVELLNAAPGLSANDLYRVLFAIAPQPGNLLNAERLHRSLTLMRMPERDTIFGFATYDELFDDSSPVPRLARWAATGPYPHYDPLVIQLACIPLCWLLSSPNRYMRDWITKALVQLLHGHLDVMRALVERFWNVDDPYVVQRVIAIAYGALLRSAPTQAADAAALATAVHTRVFARPVRADELLLDAARGITRWAVAHLLLPATASRAAERPYGLPLPGAAPTQATLDAKYGRYDDVPADQDYLSVFVSVLGMGDFGRYVVESGMHYFSRHRRGQSRPSRGPQRAGPRLIKYRWARFLASLSPQQKTEHAAWLADPQPHAIALRRYSLTTGKDPFTPEQHKLLDAVWKYPEIVDDDYPADQARRWVFRRTLSLGWTPARFRAKDRTIGQGRGREGHKSERWGKKYQWMAYHELLARVADNYASADRYDDSPTYDGLHRLIGDREIDPSLPPIDFRVFSEHDGLDATAWQPTLIRLTTWPAVDLEFRHYHGDIQRLLADTATEPTISNSTFLRDTDGTDWVVLESSTRVTDPAAHKSWRGLQQSCSVHTLLIAATGAAGFLTTLAERSRYRALDLIDSHGHVDCCYVGEVGRAGPACHHRHAGFDTVSVADKRFTIGRTVEPYTWEGNIYDCSIGETANTLLPSTLLQQTAGLTFDMRGPSWLDTQGSPIFTFYQEPGSSNRALLVRASYLRDFLSQHDLELVVLHFFERMELKDDYDRGGPLPSINSSAEARLTCDLTVHNGLPRREERDVLGP
ncbi:hypothetical protein [Actinoplanes philippinensis]|uniref:hypothetical protein n=1 Tax=Actinoplanes philippinensis TaxID=35752 RepID=UPI00116051B1|nr:hypothetical protein [Actinoplanes philippinensis]